MQSKKRVSIFVALIVISIIGISIVSASWFSDLFNIGKSDGSDEGLADVKPAKAYANVTSPLNPPVIVYVSKPYYPVPSGGIPLNPYGAPGTGVNFSFIALEDQGTTCGNTNLPTTLIVGTNVLGNFSAPSSELTRNIVSCTSIGEVTVTWGGSPCSARNYSCSVTAQYYDRGAKGSFNWSISIRILQPSNNMWSNVNNTQIFQYNSAYSIELSHDWINWTGASSLSLGAKNITSNNNVTIYNRGNINLLYADYDLQMNATRLNRTTTPITSDFIASKNFSADDDPTPCDRPGFDDEQNTDLEVDILKYVPSVTSGGKNVTFCALTVPGNVLTGIYESQRNWRILTSN